MSNLSTETKEITTHAAFTRFDSLINVSIVFTPFVLETIYTFCLNKYHIQNGHSNFHIKQLCFKISTIQRKVDSLYQVIMRTDYVFMKIFCKVYKQYFSSCITNFHKESTVNSV